MSQLLLTKHSDPAIRSTVYKLLSIGFKYPTQEVFKSFQNGEYLTELWNNIKALPHQKSLVEEEPELTQKVQDSMAEVTFADFEGNYVNTFDVGTPAPPFPLYEGNYRSENKPELMLQISAFYDHFGLGISKEENKRELPDYLCVELEFLHFLAFKEAQAISEKDQDLLTGYILAQKDFLDRHMMKWIPKFYEKFQSSAELPFYVQLARIMSMFIVNDFKWVNSNLLEAKKGGENK